MTSNTASASTVSTMSLSVRLLRDNFNVNSSLRASAAGAEVPAIGVRLFTSQTRQEAPDWSVTIDHFAPGAGKSLSGSSCGAVLFIEVPRPSTSSVATFAITFGSGHHMLESDAFVRNFGLKVALNSITRGALRNMDVATLDSTTMQRRIQASRTVDLNGFGIDVNNDLLRLAGGVPTDAAFASSLAGKDALTIRAKMSAVDIASKCSEALRLFESDDYKKDYGFIDKIVPVTDKVLQRELDDLLFLEIKLLILGKVSDLHISMPDVVDPELAGEFSYYGVGFKSGAKSGYAELAIEDYISEINLGRPADIRTIDDVKTSHEVRIVTKGAVDKKKRKRIYDCFVADFDHNGKNYVLFSGDWYCIDSAFFSDVEFEYNRLLAKSFHPTTKAKNERDLIVELDANPDLLCIDQVKASPAGAAGANLEPCDFLSRKMAFIHLKDGHGSAPISHLWNQGLVSAESFVRDGEFRSSFKKKATKRQKASKKSGFEKIFPAGLKRPDVSVYTVIYGIMRHPYVKSGKLGLPFFSKVSLGVISRRIELMGYKVELHLIEKS